MGKPVKIILSLVATLIILAAIVAGALSFLVDPNDYKSEITAFVKEKTGRDLVLEGELKLSLFPWLGISTKGIAFSNAQEFEGQPFASIEEGTINIKLLPLFAKKIEISRIVLKNLVLNLARNKGGKNNWDDLKALDKPAAMTPSASDTNTPGENNFLNAFAIAGIIIENAQINWDNQQTGKGMEIKNVNLNAGQFRVNEPVVVDLSFMALNTDANLSGSVTLTTELTVNEKFDRFVFSHCDLHSTTEGLIVPDKSLDATVSTDVALDLQDQTAKISGLQIKSGDLKIFAELSGTGIKDRPSFQGPVNVEQFSPAKVFEEWAIALPAMEDNNALNKLAVNFDLQATEELAAFQNLSVNLDDSQIRGFMRISNFAQPEIAFDLDIDTIDADRYLPPATNTNKPISSPASALAAVASSVPVETLRKLNASGELSLQKLKISDLTMQDIHLKLNAKNGIVTTQQTIKQFYQGAYSGNLNINASDNEPALALNESVDHVQIEPLLKDYKSKVKMSGIVNASAQLHGQGKTAGSMKSSLDGRLSFKIKDSVIKGFNLQKIIDNGKALVKGSPIPMDQKNDQTLFSDITGTANVKRGLIQNHDLLAKSSKLRVNGKGNADLNTEKLDYQLTARLIKTEATATEPEQLHDTPVVIHIGGTFRDPAYTLDAASLLNEKNKAKIEKILDKNKDKVDKLMDKLDKKLGPGASDLLKRLF